MQDGDWELPAVDLTLVDPRYLRQKVPYSSPYPVGTIIVDTSQHFLHLVQENQAAIRYGIGVGRDGFAWSGEAQIARKAAWPFWYPPVEMQARDEKARRWAGGMPGGLENPLGARALYLYQNGRDTLYRIHGTAEAQTIGRNVSSGCIRMMNHDVIDLSGRVPVGTNVIVLGAQLGES
jgi:lipoprotein-anchoring transpeptidase ErfK/SrfK